MAEWTPCIVDSTHKHCDVPKLAYWATVHTLRVTETNGLGSETTWARFRLSKLRECVGDGFRPIHLF